MPYLRASWCPHHTVVFFHQSYTVILISIQSPVGPFPGQCHRTKALPSALFRVAVANLLNTCGEAVESSLLILVAQPALLVAHRCLSRPSCTTAGRQRARCAMHPTSMSLRARRKVIAVSLAHHILATVPKLCANVVNARRARRKRSVLNLLHSE